MFTSSFRILVLSVGSHQPEGQPDPLNSVLRAHMQGTPPDTHTPQCIGEPSDTQTPLPVAQADFSLSIQNQLNGAPGEDESNVNDSTGHAVTCENCFNRNGLARDDVAEDMRESFTPQLLTSFVLGSSLRSKTFFHYYSDLMT